MIPRRIWSPPRFRRKAGPPVDRLFRCRRCRASRCRVLPLPATASARRTGPASCQRWRRPVRHWRNWKAARTASSPCWRPLTALWRSSSVIFLIAQVDNTRQRHTGHFQAHLAGGHGRDHRRRDRRREVQDGGVPLLQPHAHRIRLPRHRVPT